MDAVPAPDNPGGEDPQADAMEIVRPNETEARPRRRGVVVPGIAALIGLTLAGGLYGAIGADRPSIEVGTKAMGTADTLSARDSAVSPPDVTQVAAGEATSTSPPTSKTTPTSSPRRRLPAPPPRKPSVEPRPAQVAPTLASTPSLPPPPWLPDSGFASGGTLTMSFGPYMDQPSDMVIQPDGKIVIAGSSPRDPSTGARDAVVIRLNPDGTRDATFAAGGQLTLHSAGADTVVLRPDGRILLAGAFGLPNQTSGSDQGGVLLQLLPNGDIDQGFGQNGIVYRTDQWPGPSCPHCLVLQSDGTIIVAGTLPRPRPPSSAPSAGGLEISMSRLTPDGAVDTSFGTNVPINDPDPLLSDSPGALARLDDGSFMVVGMRDAASGPHPVVMRFGPNGLLDTHFNGSGVKLFDFGSGDRAVAVLADTAGRAIIGVHADGQSPQTIARILSSGELDYTFGTAGTVHFVSQLAALARDSQGRIVAATDGFNNLEVFRYSADGILDPSLTGGPYQGLAAGFPTDLAVQTDGRILVSGWVWVGPLGPNPPGGYYKYNWFVQRVIPASQQPPG